MKKDEQKASDNEKSRIRERRYKYLTEIQRLQEENKIIYITTSMKRSLTRAKW